MDAAQTLLCKTLGTQEHYQPVFNCQKRVKRYKAVTQEHVQLLQDSNNHWFLSVCLNDRVQICHNLNSTLTQTLRKSIQVLCRNFSCDNENVMITFFPVQKQQELVQS